jgi:capsid protein
MPYNIAACNSSGYNYSSGQLDHQTYYSAIEVDQDDAESVVLNRIWFAWLEEAALIPGLLPAGPYGDWADSVVHLWPSRGHVDPTKMADAKETELANLTTTLTIEWSKSGHTCAEKLRERAGELKLIKDLEAEFGVTFTPRDTLPATKPDPNSEDADAEENAKAKAA